MTAFGWRRAAWTLLGTLLIVNFVIVAGIRTGRSDAIDYFCPYYTLVADAARQGQLVSWTPLVDGGAPVGFEPQVGAASPLQLIFGLATGGNEFGFRLYWLTIWGLGGCGVLLLARHLAAPAWAACVAAIGFAFSAIYISHASHTSYLVTMSLFPWVLWRLDAAILQRSWFAAVQAVRCGASRPWEAIRAWYWPAADMPSPGASDASSSASVSPMYSAHAVCGNRT